MHRLHRHSSGCVVALRLTSLLGRRTPSILVLAGFSKTVDSSLLVLVPLQHFQVVRLCSFDLDRSTNGSRSTLFEFCYSISHTFRPKCRLGPDKGQSRRDNPSSCTVGRFDVS